MLPALLPTGPRLCRLTLCAPYCSALPEGKRINLEILGYRKILYCRAMYFCLAKVSASG
jgi:hypothetical protein